ncbi:Spindle and kinetochore-associated protein 1 [Oopsacas minuta]|uniref:SKA complex subunit 1 n=1 Tax=Oopsacas minuta TaxID=111878 RepID=A0AAV7JCR0_9METZ|nr:Spindle and kinetochore-associated protein 1 [Oopsacas minuta]
MASPKYETDLQTISMEDLVHNLTAKMEILVESISVLSCKSTPEFNTDLQELEQVLESQEDMTVEFNRRIDELHSQTSELGELLESVQEENRLYKHALDHLPAIPIEKPKIKQQPNPPTTQNNSLPQIKKTRSTKQVSRIGLLTEDEFNKTPAYVRGRMGYQKFTMFVEKLQTVLDEKYKIASLHPSKIPMSKIKYYHDCKDAETAETKGGYFFIEEDLKILANLVLDPTLRTVLTILRHHHLIKEIRGNKLVSTKLKDALKQSADNAEKRIIDEQKTISHARRVSKAQERSMSEEGKKKRKKDQLEKQLTEIETETDYPVSSLQGTIIEKKHSSSAKVETKETNKDPQSTASSIVSSAASSEDSSHTGAPEERGKLLTSISSFNKTGLKKAETNDTSGPQL